MLQKSQVALCSFLKDLGLLSIAGTYDEIMISSKFTISSFKCMCTQFTSHTRSLWPPAERGSSLGRNMESTGGDSPAGSQSPAGGQRLKARISKEGCFSKWLKTALEWLNLVLSFYEPMGEAYEFNHVETNNMCHSHVWFTHIAPSFGTIFGGSFGLCDIVLPSWKQQNSWSIYRRATPTTHASSR